jgi:hypothetical protein
MHDKDAYQDDSGDAPAVHFTLQRVSPGNFRPLSRSHEATAAS